MGENRRLRPGETMLGLAVVFVLALTAAGPVLALFRFLMTGE